MRIVVDEQHVDSMHWRCSSEAREEWMAWRRTGSAR